MGGSRPSHMLLMIEHVVLDPCGCHQGRWIDDFEPMVGEANDLLLAKDLKRSADVDVSETERLTNVALAQRQVNGLAWLDRKPATEPDIDLEKQMRDALPGAAKTEVSEVVVRTRFIGGHFGGRTEQQGVDWSR